VAARMCPAAAKKPQRACTGGPIPDRTEEVVAPALRAEQGGAKTQLRAEGHACRLVGKTQLMGVSGTESGDDMPAEKAHQGQRSLQPVCLLDKRDEIRAM
jgi:hypothetical protein